MKRPPALVLWAIAFWALAAGQLLAQWLPPDGGPLLVLANVLVSVANAFFLLGIATHFKHPIRPRWPFLLVAMYAVVLTLMLTVSAARHVEEPVFAVHSLVWDVWIIWWLLVRSPKALKASSILTALVFVADLLFYLMKALLEARDGVADLPGFAAGVISSNYLFGTLSTMLLAIGLLAMLAEKMTNDLRHAAEHDALTGVPNRAVFTRRARRQIARCNKEGAPFVLMLCDLDDFKGVNDRWGHGAGDQALKHFSAQIRSVGLPRTALFSRYGGEEFAVFLPGFEQAQAAELAERLRLYTEQSPVDHDGERIPLTVSIGAVVARNVPYEQAVEIADVALYAAKDAGRNRVQWAEYSLPA
ncbi:GGDEF domain-containing protein [Thermomonas sp. HDW16]|uniref:GGDEF domain-containing protein n=1 Tax=Thermomonas sp. HDW16 TaxID=2714945 RepID=UPI001407A81E|nr:GGDEF domain-containing protein [Thermomonas sp. HDW16]QIL20826.1 GGDEF domain-containing protein [Thermomonas sp. HDW16]